MPTPPSPSAFHAALLKMQKEQLSEWRIALQAVKIDQLSIGYAHGKQLEQVRDQGLQWVAIVGAATDKVLKTDALPDEILLAADLNELMHSLSDVALALSEVDLPKGNSYNARNAWTEKLQALSGGPVNKLSQSTLDFATARAYELERNCRK